MDRQLRIIANAIVSNLENTERIGLMDGKMGICLFLYHYAHYTGVSMYERLAEKLLDHILSQLHPNIDHNVMSGLAGIGIGLSWIIGEGYVKDVDNVCALKEIDNMLLYETELSFLKERDNTVKLYSSGIYLIHRIKYYNRNLSNFHIQKIIKYIPTLLQICKREKGNPSITSLLLSILYVVYSLGERKYIEKNEALDYINTCIFLLSNPFVIDESNVTNSYFFDMKKFFCMIKDRPLLHGSLFSNIIRKEEANYKNIWWTFIFDNFPIKYKIDSMKLYHTMMDFNYHINDLNLELSALGINIYKQIKTYKNENNFK